MLHMKNGSRVVGFPSEPLRGLTKDPRLQCIPTKWGDGHQWSKDLGVCLRCQLPIALRGRTRG